MNTLKVFFVGLILVLSSMLIVNYLNKVSKVSAERPYKNKKIDRTKYGILVWKYQDTVTFKYKYIAKHGYNFLYQESNLTDYQKFIKDFNLYDHIPFDTIGLLRLPNAYIDLRRVGFTDSYVIGNFDLIKIER